MTTGGDHRHPAAGRDLTALSNVIEYAIGDRREEDEKPPLTRLRRLKERRDPIVLPENRLTSNSSSGVAPAALAP